MAFKSLRSLEAVSTTDSQFSLTTSYQVDNSDNPVFMNLIFGPLGISSMSKIKLDTLILANGETGSIEDFNIGSNINLNGKFLTIFIIVTVTEITPVPVNVTADFSLTGGINDYRQSLSHIVNEVGNSIFFKIETFFFN